MGGHESTQSAAAGAGARDAHVARELARVQPVVERVLARACRVNGLPVDEAEDVRALVLLRVVRRLQNGGEDAVGDIEAYAATLTRNALHDLLRARYPERARLKNRLRFLLGHDARFATWTDGGTVVCGLREWQARSPLPVLASAELPACGDLGTAEELIRVLHVLGGPVEVEALISALMQAWNVVETAAVDADPALLVAPAPSQLESFEQRELVGRLWSEIALLPPLQRSALLLNLRDHQGGNALLLFLLLEVATFDALAEAAGMSAEVLSLVWNDLPLDDLAIAERLGVRRQQVINLRKSARERLARRLRR
jgi:RNA polymerase sigma factor (sigma-70 family)